MYIMCHMTFKIYRKSLTSYYKQCHHTSSPRSARQESHFDVLSDRLDTHLPEMEVSKKEISLQTVASCNNILRCQKYCKIDGLIHRESTYSQEKINRMSKNTVNVGHIPGACNFSMSLNQLQALPTVFHLLHPSQEQSLIQLENSVLL